MADQEKILLADDEPPVLAMLTSFWVAGDMQCGPWPMAGRP